MSPEGYLIAALVAGTVIGIGYTLYALAGALRRRRDPLRHWSPPESHPRNVWQEPERDSRCM